MFRIRCLFKQRSAYDMCISDCSSDVCSSDLVAREQPCGLLGEYFNNRWLYGPPILTLVDKTVDFYWQASDTMTPTGKDYISIRWTGFLLPSYDETYELILQVNDGARLLVHEQLVIDEYANAVETGGDVAFSAVYPEPPHSHDIVRVRLAFPEHTDPAKVALH